MTTERTALKEWAVIVDALARGSFCAIVRKGGIREQRSGFSARYERFLLYPTWFHENPEGLAPRLRGQRELMIPPAPEGQIRFTYLADVRAVWRVTDLERMWQIEAEHGLSAEAVRSRFEYRDNPVLHVIALQLSELSEPVLVPETPRYQGCVSWVRLDHDVDVSQARRVVSDAQIASRLSALRASLGEPLQAVAAGNP